MERRFGIVALGLLATLLAAANIVLGDLNLDEGWYLNAALLVADGKAPYRDFFFTQAPLLPDVYALLSPLWRPFGIVGGRMVTAIIGIAAALAAAAAVRPAVPEKRKGLASAMVFALLACNIYHSYFTVIPKTYALASLMISLGALAASRMRDAGCGMRNATLAAASGFAMAAAAAARLSLGVALAAGGVALLAQRRRLGPAWLFYGIGGLAGLGLLLAPRALAAPDAFMFANFFHGARAGGGIAMVLGSASRLARNYWPMAMLVFACGAIVHADARPAVGPADGAWRMGAGWGAVFAAVFVVHILSPFPYDDYQVPAMPLLACGVVSLAMCALPESERLDRALWTALPLIAWFAALTSPLNESWLVVRKDRFWVEIKEEPDILRVARVGRMLRQSTPDGAPILTTDTYLAVEAGRPVPQGFEMGAFGYFPALSDEEARKYHVLNRNVMAETAADCGAPCAAFSGYAFAMAAPAMTRIGEAEREELLALAMREYKKTGEVRDFGQEHTTLVTATRRTPGGRTVTLDGGEVKDAGTGEGE